MLCILKKSMYTANIYSFSAKDVCKFLYYTMSVFLTFADNCILYQFKKVKFQSEKKNILILYFMY